MPDLKSIQEPVAGTVIIKVDSQYHDIDADSVTVNANVTARLYGSVKNLILNKGSLVYLHGIITGNVLNMGGEIHVFKK